MGKTNAAQIIRVHDTAVEQGVVDEDIPLIITDIEIHADVPEAAVGVTADRAKHRIGRIIHPYGPIVAECQRANTRRVEEDNKLIVRSDEVGGRDVKFQTEVVETGPLVRRTGSIHRVANLVIKKCTAVASAIERQRVGRVTQHRAHNLGTAENRCERGRREAVEIVLI